MEKLSEIPWGIPNDKWIKHKFAYQNGVARMAGQKIAIHLQNMMGCLKFLMAHPSFRNNQTYKPSYICNKNK